MNVKGWSIWHNGRRVGEIEKLESGQLLLKVYDRKQKCFVDDFIDTDEAEDFVGNLLAQADRDVERVETDIEDFVEEINMKTRDLEVYKDRVKQLDEFFTKN